MRRATCPPVGEETRSPRKSTKPEAPSVGRPGGDAPFLIEAWRSHGGLNLQVPRDELTSDEWLTIQSIVRDLELAERDCAADLLAGYFCRSHAPWER